MVSIVNMDTGSSIQFDTEPYCLSEIDYGTSKVSFTTYKKQSGASYISSSLNDRTVKIIGFILNRPGIDVMERKLHINSVLAPFTKLRLQYGDYYLDCYIKESLKFKSEVYLDNPNYTEFQIQLDALSPYFYKAMPNRTIAGDASLFHVPFRPHVEYKAPIGSIGTGSIIFDNTGSDNYNPFRVVIVYNNRTVESVLNTIDISVVSLDSNSKRELHLKLKDDYSLQMGDYIYLDFSDYSIRLVKGDREIDLSGQIDYTTSDQIALYVGVNQVTVSPGSSTSPDDYTIRLYADMHYMAPENRYPEKGV